MNATEFKVRLTVDCEFVLPDTSSYNALLDHLDAIRDRVQEQLAGHRTPMRLADRCSVSNDVLMLSSINRKLP